MKTSNNSQQISVATTQAKALEDKLHSSTRHIFLKDEYRQKIEVEVSNYVGIVREVLEDCINFNGISPTLANKIAFDRELRADEARSAIILIEATMQLIEDGENIPIITYKGLSNMYIYPEDAFS